MRFPLKSNSLNNLIRKQHITLHVFDNEASISWSFNELTSDIGLIRYIECIMSDGNIKAYGYGDSFLKNISLTQAFCEAWERYIFLRLSAVNKSITSSNGFAAGPTLVDANNRALEELLERELVLRAWKLESGFDPYSLKTIRAKLISQFIQTKHQWHFIFYLIKSTTPYSTLFGISHHKDFGIVSDSVCLSDIEQAPSHEMKIIRSLLKLMSINNCVTSINLSELNEHSGPLDHIRFYKDSTNSKLFLDKLNRSTNSTPVILDKVDQVKCSSIYSAGDLPYVSFAMNANWHKLEWGLNSYEKASGCVHPIM